MARRHGWQLPAHSFQALSVFILYVRCTAIDPADPGILIEADNDKISAYTSHVGTELTEDCRKDEINLEEENGEEEALFCTLCNAEVRKFSKHCRSCDKCVDGFDHHCRWLNNCVGRKTYISFVCIMAASLAWLVFECAVGIAVLVRCFVDRKATENAIVDRLEDGFSRPPFATVVALCTAVSLLATVPLGELFFFHIILIRKGITTYEYVVAMRTQSEPPGPSVDGGDQQSLPSSPTSSAVTAISGNIDASQDAEFDLVFVFASRHC
ncbi:hypothetical protein SASPL_137002 [Salvia splendens]|uniref:S-acyltransferase n=1 Tax=Salvia splendens TaxID=180675 RepID=A0A8X8WSE5_SALSN|nr:hypothetical protein SASPL_137002 [Salvia splendens]